MKCLLLTLFMVITQSIVYSQAINQVDENGKNHGLWKKNFEKTNVLRYEGEFSHGREVGLFKFYKNINGKAVLSATKQFDPANNTAYVKFLASNGSIISEGLMHERDYVGVWKYYHKNSNQLMTLEHYNKNGQLEGERLIYYANGQIAEKTLYKNGQLDGKAVWYSENAVLIKENNYVLGELHGEAIFYDKNGKLIIEGQYKRDKKHGVWKYYEDGKLKEEKDFTVVSKNPYKKK